MNFADEIRENKKMEESTKERYERLVKNGEKHRNEDVIKVSNKIITIVKDKLQNEKIKEEYIQGFFGKYKHTGRKYIETQFWVDQIHPRFHSYDGRIAYTDYSDEEGSYKFIYAEINDIDDIQNIIKKWCEENDIEFNVEISHRRYHYFRYRFKLWL